MKLYHVQVLRMSTVDVTLEYKWRGVQIHIQSISIVIYFYIFIYIFISLAPVNGGWSQWSSYSTCSNSCGVGDQSRYRSCNNPSPSNGGSTCAGVSTETIHCHTEACPCSGSHCPGQQFIIYCIITCFNLFTVILDNCKCI